MHPASEEHSNRVIPSSPPHWLPCCLHRLLEPGLFKFQPTEEGSTDCWRAVLGDLLPVTITYLHWGSTLNESVSNTGRSELCKLETVGGKQEVNKVFASALIIPFFSGWGFGTTNVAVRPCSGTKSSPKNARSQKLQLFPESKQCQALVSLPLHSCGAQERMVALSPLCFNPSFDRAPRARQGWEKL